MEVRGSFLIFLLISVTACFPQRKPLSPLLTQDRYGSGVPLGGSDVQQGMALNQNAFLPLLLGNPDFLKLYMENPLLASQYVTLLMRVASGRANNNDCPAIARTCPTECYSISSTGCIVCQCPQSHASSQSSTSSNSTHTGAAASTSAGNNNGCPSFPTHCDPNCLALDDMGCPICSCPKTPQSAGPQTLTSSGATASPSKVNGCAPFPRNCSAECARIDSMGCIVCSCPSGQTGKTPAPSSSSSSSQGNINGCQPFPKSCRVECAMVDSRGCIACQCPSTGSSNSSATTSQTATSAGNGINGCPPFPKSCDSLCVKLDDLGCVICSCPYSSNNSSQTGVQQIGNYVNVQGQGLAGNGNGCPSLDPKCPAQCTSTDDRGCIRCTCSTSPPSSVSQSASVSSSNAGGCPAIPKNCQLTCLNIDASGCVVCSCPSNAGTSGFGATCPPFKADDCDDVCKMTDAHGCPICDCSQHFSSTTSPSINTNTGGGPSGGGVPGAGGCPTFDFSDCDPACVSVDDHGCMSCSCAATAPVGGQSTTVGAVTSVPGAGGCPAFDFSTCDPNCVVMDAQGCLSCHCAVTTPATSGGQSNTTSGAVTSVPGAGGCPAFDFSTCDPNCVVMDDKGCLSCSCAVATMAPSGIQSSTSGAITSVPGAGGCSSFDFSTCDPKCVVMDAQGCMSCTCTVTTQAPSTTNKTTGTTSVPGAGGCSPFDFSTCDPNCVIMDAQGCLSCQCKATTVAPSGQSTSETVTSVPGAGGCPAFEFSTCDPSCVVMDGQGCMSCHCKASTPSPLGGQTSTIGAVTSVPGAGGCPSFDFGTCDPNCVVMNSQGCLSCHCTGSTTAPTGPTTQQVRPTTSVPGAGGCSSFDFSACNPNCVVMDSRGCLTCHCAASSTAASGYTTASVTSVPGAGGCPSFDFNRCDPACVVMDAQGCMTCSCSGNQSGKQTIVPVPTTTPRPSSTTRPPISSTTVTPRSITAHAPPTTTGNTCPPIRCTYPCDLGVVFDAQRCPVCKCRSSTASP
ncbi:mucin-5AC-like isoform X4 [Crassostrea angulata]|uniref:mucin-5AC-like isoform X4 n=1 Tax=Magallana angulata TaxID=2784310 RepID=UPI0022B194B9|nr:mucin-5AC-like isoform X4 [Crassostrea angulata]